MEQHGQISCGTPSQTGEDFIRFDRDQATNLRDTLDKFLSLDRHAATGVGEGGEELEAAEAVVVEEAAVVTRPRRHRRRKTA